MRHRHPWLLALSLLALTPTARADQARDLLVGNGTPGPYALSWKGLAAGTEQVQVNAQTQTRGLDYTFDPDAGTITFARPLPTQSAAAVAYAYDPAHAVRTGADLALPLAFDLAHGDQGTLSLNALYTRSGGAPQTDPGSLSVGLGGGWQDARASLTTRLLFAPALSSQDAVHSPNGLARTGLSLAGTADPSPVAHFSFGYARAGVGLTGTTGGDAWQSGTQTLTVGTRLTPSRQVLATVDYARSDPLAPNSQATAHLSGALTLTPSNALQLQTHWTTMTTSGGSTDAEDVSVTAKPTAAAQVSASFAAQDAPDSANDTQTLNLAAQVTPSRAVSLSAAAGQSRLGTATTDHQEVGLSLSPQAVLQMHTRLALSQTDQFNTTAATFGGTLQPVSYLQFSADYTSRSAPVADTAAQDTLDSSAAQVAFAPVKGLRLTGRYAQNPDTGGDFQRLARRGLGLETALGALSLSGGYDWTRQYQAPSVGTTLNLGLGLRLSRALQITGGYTQTLTGVGEAPTGTSLYTFGLTHNLGDRFSLSMRGTMQQPVGPATTAPAPGYTASADLGMKF